MVAEITLKVKVERLQSLLKDHTKRLEALENSYTCLAVRGVSITDGNASRDSTRHDEPSKDTKLHGPWDQTTLDLPIAISSEEDKSQVQKVGDVLSPPMPENRITWIEKDRAEWIEESNAYFFGETVWELTTIIGTHGTSKLENLWCLGLLCATVVLEAVVCQVLYVSSISSHKSQQSKAESAYTWRTTAGHRYNLADSRGVSMVSRLCNLNSNSLEFSGEQNAEFGLVDSYLRNTYGYPIGTILCVLCLFIWFLVIWSEIKQICARLEALNARCFATIGTNINITDDGLEVESVSRRRFVVVAIFGAIRAGVAVSLLIVGTLWLSHTEDVEALILDAAALAFILELDEMLFAVLCPTSIRVLISRLRPIPLPKPPSRLLRNFGGAGSGFFGAMIFLIISHSILLQPLVSTLRDTWQAYCGEDVDFVLGMNPVSGIAYSYAYNGSGAQRESWFQRISREIMTSSNAEHHVPTASWASFQSSISMDLNEAIQKYGKCSNMVLPEDSVLYAALQQAFPLEHGDVPSCDVLSKAACLAYPAARFVCPETCGCDKVLSGEFMLRGCPLSKCETTNQFQDQRVKARRFDIERNLLINMPEWKMYWGEYVEWMNGHITQHTIAESPDLVASKFLELGCDAFLYFRGEFEDVESPVQRFLCASFTEEFGGSRDDMLFRPVRPFCPQSCGCPGRRRAVQGMYCPTKFDYGDELGNPSETELVCAKLRIAGEGLKIHPASEGCEQTVSDESTPEGSYDCLPFAYNGKHLYRRTDSEGTLWLIRWETVSHMDSGAYLLGGKIGLQEISKWTLVSIDSEKVEMDEDADDFYEDSFQLTFRDLVNSRTYNGNSLPVVARFFATGVEALPFPPRANWFPRNATNSDAQCAEGTIGLEGHYALKVASSSSNTCPSNYSSISSMAGCVEAALALDRRFDEDDAESSDKPYGCYLSRRRDSGTAIFNSENGTGCEECHPVCQFSSSLERL